MHINYEFKAPWSRQLKWVTGLSSAVLLGIPLLVLARAPQAESAWASGMVWFPLALLALSALFAIRGYRLQGDKLLILRPGWTTRIPLAELQSAEVDAEAMAGSIRVFGNGGLFGFIGLFRSGKLANYRAFATDPALAVVLRFPARTLVITPDRPQKLVSLLNEQLGA